MAHDCKSFPDTCISRTRESTSRCAKLGWEAGVAKAGVVVQDRQMVSMRVEGWTSVLDRPNHNSRVLCIGPLQCCMSNPCWLSGVRVQQVRLPIRLPGRQTVSLHSLNNGGCILYAKYIILTFNRSLPSRSEYINATPLCHTAYLRLV